jgi:hypothetical protein
MQRLVAGLNSGVRNFPSPENISSHYPPGKSLEIIPMGVTRLQIDQDIYVWCARI